MLALALFVLKDISVINGPGVGAQVMLTSLVIMVL